MFVCTCTGEEKQNKNKRRKQSEYAKSNRVLSQEQGIKLMDMEQEKKAGLQFTVLISHCFGFNLKMSSTCEGLSMSLPMQTGSKQLSLLVIMVTGNTKVIAQSFRREGLPEHPPLPVSGSGRNAMPFGLHSARPFSSLTHLPFLIEE